MDNAMFYELAKRHAAKINPFGALCQCNWETHSGGKAWTSSLFVQGNNGAGIKAGKNWTGKVISKQTWEQRPDGSKYDTVAAFRAYDSVDDFLEDYADKINTCYPLCATDNLFGYFAGLYKGKYGSWATDQAYFSKLCGVAVELAPEIFGRGEMWKNKLLDAFEYAMQQHYLTNDQANYVFNLLKKTAATNHYADPKPAAAGGHVVMLDAGHGGRDPGACGNGLREKDITLLICQALGRELVKRGYDVHYTRATDEYLGLSERAALANKIKADIIVAIHCNSASTSAADGFEVWTTKGQTRADLLATDIFNAYAKLIGGKMRQDKSDGDADKENNWTVIYAASMPGVLIETLFISNPDDAARLASADWREKVAGAVANGIDAYFARG